MEEITGVVHSVGGGSYQVVFSPEGAPVEAYLRGRLKLEDRVGDQVVIGDRVGTAQAADGSYVIEKVFPRENAIVRSRGSGAEIKVLVANVDRVLLIVAVRRPQPRVGFIDRMLVLVESEGIRPLVVINKMDLMEAESEVEVLEGVYRSIGYDVIRTSTVTNEGIDRLALETARGITVFAGQSGVGKSSLINSLEPQVSLRTAQVSARSGTGRHTTVRARLIPFSNGGLLADTPGFSDAGVKGLVTQSGLDSLFPEFLPYTSDCQFRNCSHLHEPGCSVRVALSGGAIHSSRFESYRMLYSELQAS
ncbi:MAG: ribosome small subunit-dependent GTPase A [bacterium]